MYDLKPLYNSCCAISELCEELLESGRNFLELEIPRTREALTDFQTFPLLGIEQILSQYSGIKDVNVPYDEYHDVKELATEIIGRMVTCSQFCTDLQKEFSMYGHSPEEHIVYRIKSDASMSFGYLETVLTDFRKCVNSKSWTQFHSMTKFIPELEQTSDFGHWVFDTKTDPVTKAHYAPYVHYEELPFKVLDAVYAIIKEIPEYENIPDVYILLLEKRGIKWNDKSMAEANASELDDIGILALFVGIACAERFSDGTIDRFFSKGCTLRWLNRLQELDCKAGV